MPIQRATFDGCAWTFVGEAADWLASVPARAWADPRGNGWELVKHNARREVWRAVIGGRPCYLKYHFYGPWREVLTRWFRPSSCAAEWAGGLFALRNGISAVRPVAYTRGLQRARTPGTGRAGRCALLVTEAVEPAQPLNEFWLQLQSDENVARRRCDTRQLIETLAELIARAHQAGFEHLDMHAANILVQTVAPRRYQAVFVDLQSARLGVPLSDRAVVRNLAQLNQWFRRHSTTMDRLRFLRAYLRWRNEFEDRFEYSRPLGLSFDQLVAALATAAQRHASHLGRQRDRRALRGGRYFTRVRLPGGWRGLAMRCCKHPQAESRASQLTFERRWWETQLAALVSRWCSCAADPSGDAAAPAALCKESHSARVGRAVLECGPDRIPVIVKRPRARNWRRRLAQLCSPSRSRRAWRTGYALLNRDVPTARPLAVLERRWGPFVRDSLLITEAIPGASDLESFLRAEHVRRTAREWWHLKRELMQRLVNHLRRLEERGFVHRDCKAGNILVVPYPELRLLWIDLDGIRATDRVSNRARLRALARLEVSLRDVPGLTRTDRVRFVRAYWARFGAAEDAWRQMWPALFRAAARQQRATDRHRAWKLAHYGRP